MSHQPFPIILLKVSHSGMTNSKVWLILQYLGILNSMIQYWKHSGHFQDIIFHLFGEVDILEEVSMLLSAMTDCNGRTRIWKTITGTMTHIVTHKLLTHSMTHSSEQIFRMTWMMATTILLRFFLTKYQTNIDAAFIPHLNVQVWLILANDSWVWIMYY